ncbi:anoctamin-2-like isoform X2 [Adelges cooleyi]|uniref:anoctamin-2-like isoform X2 n=1 Tax=Adelges cooleyi TaxID=133065 RepID=UPI00217F936B|nr:anoctamin-2-like isoform X2 [Adelges cooleyi]
MLPPSRNAKDFVVTANSRTPLRRQCSPKGQAVLDAESSRRQSENTAVCMAQATKFVKFFKQSKRIALDASETLQNDHGDTVVSPSHPQNEKSKITNGCQQNRNDDDVVDFVLAYRRQNKINISDKKRKFNDEEERQKLYKELNIRGVLVRLDDDSTISLDAGRTCFALLRLSRRLLRHRFKCKCETLSDGSDSEDETKTFDPKHYKCEQSNNQKVKENHDKPLTSAQRAQIVWRIILEVGLNSNNKCNENVMSLDQLLDANIITAAYPPHDGNLKSDSSDFINDRQRLYEQWARPGLIIPKSWKSDLEVNALIRRYYGTPVAVYFSWLRFYTIWLVGPAIAGLIWFLYGLMTTRNDPPTRDICDPMSQVADWILCPTRKCDNQFCGFTRVLDTCGLYRWTSAATFDRPGAVVFAVFMSFWATAFQQLWTVRGDILNEPSEDITEQPTFYCEKCDKSRSLSIRSAQQMPENRKLSMLSESNSNTTSIPMVTRPMVSKPNMFVRIYRWYVGKIPTIIHAAVFCVTLIVAAAIPVLIVVYRGRAIGLLMSNVFHQDEKEQLRWSTQHHSEQRHHSFFLLNYTTSGELSNWKTAVVTMCAAFVQLAAIVAVHRAYSAVAEWLTKFTYGSVFDPQFQSLYTVFMSCFDSANYYSSLVYIAFFKGRFVTSRQRHVENATVFSNFWPIAAFQKLIHHVREDVCDPAAAGTGCVPELCIQLAIIMIGKQMVDNFIELSMPLSLNLWRRWRAKVNRQKNMQDKKMDVTTTVPAKQWQLDYQLEDTGSLGLYQEYSEMVVQYGFVVLFTTSFPLAPLCALLNNILEQRLDAYKMVVAQRRPVPAYFCTGSAHIGSEKNLKCCDNCLKLGTWNSVLKILSVIAVVYNAFVIAFTSDLIPRTVYEYNFAGQSPSLEGYVAWTLSTERNMTEYYYDGRSAENRPDVCRYRGQSEQNSFFHWRVLAARLTFSISYEVWEPSFNRHTPCQSVARQLIAGSLVAKSIGTFN